MSKLKEKKCYDFCYCIDVLEHITENSKVILNLYHALKIGGYLYIHIPNKTQHRIFPRLFFKETEEWAKGEHIGKLYNLVELKKLVISTSFEIIKAQNTFGFFGKLAWEIDMIIHKKIILKILLVPFLRILAHLELFFEDEKGNGMIILARKL